MKLKVNGMHCGACKTLIEMELEENGIEGVNVNGETYEIEVPENLSDKIEAIKNIVNSMEGYELD